MSRKVLIVDDELDIQSSLSFALKDEGYEVETVSSPKEALEVLEQNVFHVALFDVWFPEGDGVELLKESLEKYPSMSVIMMSGHGNIELALKSIRMGAYDFLEKPLELEKVLVLLRNACETSALKFENQSLLGQLLGPLEIVADSSPMKSLKDQIEKVGPTHSHVLLTGESGVGRSLLTRFLHSKSDRAKKPLVTVHCASLSESSWEEEMLGSGDSPGRLEYAAGGTLYFNGIAEMPLAAQAHLVKILQEKRFERKGRPQKLPFDARIVASCPRNIQELVESGEFREDLYFLLKVVVLDVPALRERTEDIPALAALFLKSLGEEYGRSAPALSEELLQWLKNYDWPGNVREMKNLLERSIILKSNSSEALKLSDLPEEMSLGVSSQGDGELESLLAQKNIAGELRDLRSQFEAHILKQRLDDMGGNVTKAAESLGIERAHLHRKMKQLGLN